MSRRISTAGRLMLPFLLLAILFLVDRTTGYAQRGAVPAPAPGAARAPVAGSCPGKAMEAVQATGVYLNKPVEAVMINGKPWGGAYWDAGMRSYWHCHAAGQLMMVWEGKGRVQQRGQKIRTLDVGETEYAGPWVEHWHGAVPDASAQYLQVTFQPGPTLWMEEVGRDDYLGNDIGIASRSEFIRTGVAQKTPENR